MELLKLDQHRLTNGESITYSVDIRNVIESYPTLKALLTKVYTPFSSAIDLAVQSSSKVDTTLYSSLRAERHSIRKKDFLHFRGVAESALKSSDTVERQQAILVVNTIKLHGWRMQTLPPDKLSATLQGLFNALEAENLKEAVGGIGAGKALTNLKAANVKFLEADKQRIEVWAEEQNDICTSKALKVVVDAASNLFTAIDGLLLTSDEPLLLDMVEKMNVITEVKQQTLKAKATRAENAKKEAEENGKDKPTPKAAKRKPLAQEVPSQPIAEPDADQLVGQQLPDADQLDIEPLPQEKKAFEDNNTTE